MSEGYSIKTFCDEIHLQDEVKREVLKIYGNTDFTSYENLMNGLTSIDGAFDSFMCLAKSIAEDERQMIMLTIQLECARRCLKRYEKRGIEKSVFLATMSCFTRFVGEFYQKKGYYGFDCPWWTYRQLNMTIFRLGALEFEYESGESNTVNIHIPSDADFCDESVEQSFAFCRRFTARFYPEFKTAKFVCHSWLLSPAIAPILNENSNIFNFRKRFNVTKVFENEDQFYGFIFQTSPETPVEQLKETTSLQRKVKELLRKGIKIGAAYGEMK